MTTSAAHDHTHSSHRIPFDDSSSFTSDMMEGFHRDTAFNSSTKSDLYRHHNDETRFLLNDDLPDVNLDDMRSIDDDLSDDDCPAPENPDDIRRHLMLLAGSDDSETVASNMSSSSSYTHQNHSHSPSHSPHPTSSPSYRASHNNIGNSNHKKPSPIMIKNTIKNTIITKDGKELNIHKALTWRQKQQIPLPTLNPKRNPAKPVCLFINYLGTRLPPVMEPTVAPSPMVSCQLKGEPSCTPTDPPMVSPEPRKRTIGTSSRPGMEVFAVTHLPHDGPKSNKKRRG